MVTDQRGAVGLREWNGSTEFYGDERRAWEVHASTYYGVWFKFSIYHWARQDVHQSKATGSGVLVGVHGAHRLRYGALREVLS
jgi:hypothetical protein